MGFLFGLLVGTSMSGGPPVPPIMGSIPFRCLAAFEISEAEYRQCRLGTLSKELWNQGCDDKRQNDESNTCSIGKAMGWEITALRELKRAIDQKQNAR